MPEAAQTIAVELIIDKILHELKRALIAPIPRIHKGQLGPVHDMAVALGWLTRSDGGRVRRAYLDLTRSGRQALHDAQTRRAA